MKMLILAVALGAALAGCGEVAEESDEPATETAAATPAATATSLAGNYELTMKDGTKASSIMRADGTYMDMDAAGKETENGTWEERADGKVCFDSAGDDPVMCYALGETQADGTFVATPDTGDPITVKKTG